MLSPRLELLLLAGSFGAIFFLTYKLFRTQQLLESKRHEVRELNRQRTDFVANVSHELKTPLTSIRGYTETLRDGAIKDSTKADEFLRRIQNNADRLDLLIHDILDLSRLEATDTHLNYEEIDLHDLFRTLRETFLPKLQEKSQALRLKVEVDGIVADRHLIEQAFSNLISNAIRYCPPESILEIHGKNHSEEGKAWYRFDVIDNGPGIQEKDLSRIFERFYRGEKSRSRALGGTGLGLAIVKHIVLSHGGKVKAENLKAGGMCFSLYLPQNPTQQTF